MKGLERFLASAVLETMLLHLLPVFAFASRLQSAPGSHFLIKKGSFP